MAKVDEVDCQLLKEDDTSVGCYYDKLLITKDVKPELKVLFSRS